MCLRTRYFLQPEEEIEPGLWRCRGRLDCPGGHDYRLAIGDDEARTTVDRALSYAKTRFEKEPSQPIAVWHSPGADELPESTNGSAGEHAIYLSHSTPDQGAYQAGHEVFHTLFTPVDTHHWVHEMLAVVFALDFLAADGFEAYRRSTIEGHDRAAADLSVADLFQAVAIPYPSGTYALASVLGRQLVETAGPERFFELRRFWDVQTLRPDYASWLESLPPEIRNLVAAAAPHLIVLARLRVAVTPCSAGRTRSRSGPALPR